MNNDNDQLVSPNVKLKIIGVGGAGNNSINYLLNEGFENIEFWVMNTDTQDLNKSNCSNKLALGHDNLRGHGAGGNPELGKKMALESTEEIKEILADTDMLILSAGFGGGTGTGATPIIAKIAKEMGILTLAVVLTPFETLEGKTKELISSMGLQELKKYVDSYVLVSNEKLVEHFSGIPFIEALKCSNVILKNTIKIISDILFKTSNINIDFNDLKNVFVNGNETIIGYAKSTGKDKAVKAIEGALKNPLFNSDIKTCTKMIVNFMVDQKVSIDQIKLAIDEIDKVFSNNSNAIQKKIGIFANSKDDRDDFFEVGIIASGLNDEEKVKDVVINNYFSGMQMPNTSSQSREELENINNNQEEEISVDSENSTNSEFPDLFG